MQKKLFLSHLSPSLNETKDPNIHCLPRKLTIIVRVSVFLSLLKPIPIHFQKDKNEYTE